MCIVKNVILHNEKIVIKDGRFIVDNFISTANDLVAISGLADRLRTAASRFAGKPDEADFTVADDECVLLANNFGSGTWGHWLAQILPKCLIFVKAVPNGKVALPRSYFGSGRFRNFGQAAFALGLRPEQVIQIDREKNYLIKNAVFINAIHRGPILHPAALEVFDAPDKEYKSISCSEENENKCSLNRIYIDRPEQYGRGMVNADSIRNLIHSNGFTLKKLAEEDFISQVAHWRRGGVFCGVLGSDFTNILFGSKGSSVISITPHWFGDSFFFGLCAMRGLVWNELFCGDIVKEAKARHRSDFKVDEKQLDHFLSVVLRGL
ncbi:glycosyltransferase family 61 protein [Siccirubricoccus deserti]